MEARQKATRDTIGWWPESSHLFSLVLSILIHIKQYLMFEPTE